jgi:phytoene synthase
MTQTPSETSEWDFPNASTPVGSAAYYAVRFSPEPMRQRNALLFAWYQLVQAITEHPRDPGAARLKLDWWRQEVGNIPLDQARHPLAIELQKTGLSESASSIMRAVIDTADEEIRTATLTDSDAFGAACHGSQGNLFLLLAEVENGSGYQTEDCLKLGGYCAAIERIRRLAKCPQRVPEDLNPQHLQRIDRSQRTALIETLLCPFEDTETARMERVPDFARRLTALGRAMHSKMRRQGYPVVDTLVDRAPIAQLWTAWRCR